MLTDFNFSILFHSLIKMVACRLVVTTIVFWWCFSASAQ